jgi:hypothetical protein
MALGSWVVQVASMAGAVTVLAPFALAQWGCIRTDSMAFRLPNVVGAAVLCMVAYHERQWGFVMLEAAWLAVSIAGPRRSRA